MYLFARADVNPNWPPELATRRAHEITIVQKRPAEYISRAAASHANPALAGFALCPTNFVMNIQALPTVCLWPDSMTLLFDKEQKQIRSVQIASYMDSPSDAMNLAVQFDRLPDGTSHVSTAEIDGVSK